MKNDKLHVVYSVGFNTEGNSGKRKATREKKKALQRVSDKFAFYSVTSRTNNAFLSYIIPIALELRVCVILFFLNDKPNVVFTRTFFGHFYNILGRIFGIKIIREVHSSLKDEAKILYKENRVKRLFAKWVHNIEIASLRRCDGIIFNNPDLEDHFKKVIGIDGVNSISIYNGSNTEIFRPELQSNARKKLGIDSNKKVFVFTGSVSEWHGVEYLLNTFEKAVERAVADYLLLVVGGGQSEYHLHLKSEFEHLPFINFIDQVPVEIAKDYINAADICMLPVAKIRVSQGSPLKLFDYIACGKPVITQSNVRGYSDVVEDNNLGIAVNFYDASSAADEIIKFVDNCDPEIYRTNNRHLAENELNWNSVIKKWLDFSTQA